MIKTSAEIVIDGKAVQYSENFVRFINDMEAEGLEIIHYRGRFFYEGPAVIVDDIQDALSATRVKCQWDNMGLRMIVYPCC